MVRNMFLFIIMLISGFSILNADDTKSGEEINWQVISNGGNKGSSTSYILSGTVSQTSVESGISNTHILKQGFWQVFNLATEYICGDANSDLSVDISDAVFVINFAFGGGSAPDPLAAGDVNCDSSVDISDAVYIINYAFGGGYSPGDTDGDGQPDC